MNAGKGRPQEPTWSYGATTRPITGGEEGKRADLATAALTRASLCLVVLSDANLQGANLVPVPLSPAVR
jgi:uncharacterized protein YjbI with pentapeptide repeats